MKKIILSTFVGLSLAVMGTGLAQGTHKTEPQTEVLKIRVLEESPVMKMNSEKKKVAVVTITSEKGNEQSPVKMGRVEFTHPVWANNFKVAYMDMPCSWKEEPAKLVTKNSGRKVLIKEVKLDISLHNDQYQCKAEIINFKTM